MFIETVYDDSHVQIICYKYLTNIKSIKDERVVLNLLFSYLKSKSMNIRYIAVKILLHLSQSSLIPFKQIRTVLNDLMLDPDSNEDLWLVEEQDDILLQCIYYCKGPLKDVIYLLLVQHLTGNTSEVARRNELNDFDADFIKSEEASRVASCLYETITRANEQIDRSSTSSHHVENNNDSVLSDVSSISDDSS